ncbi:GGDEF domain-containing protein [Marinomonas sp. 2405UD68-3]|uniref:GGDEF domain-containing protein n=1 Tax=Marinomonas sp. 2405UD68-3 TaxID=3391835 RepID=UPI0039C9859D
MMEKKIMLRLFLSKFKNSYTKLEPAAAAFFSMSILVILYVGPFIFYRLYQRNWTHALIDLILFSAAVFCAIATYKGRSVKALKPLSALLLLLSATLIVVVTGIESVFWGYPAITASFFLLPLRHALISIGIFVTALFFIMLPTTEIIVISAIVTTMLLLSFSNYFIFKSYRNIEARLKEKVGKDYLTGASNRNAFEERMLELMAMCNDKPQALSIVIFDLDNFKMINDTYGHLKGDEVLVTVTKAVSKAIRIVDTIYRYGGEEFVILLPRTSLIQAKMVAEKARECIEKTDFGIERQVTISAGIAMLKHNESQHEWIKRADIALYKSKRAGRNTVTAVD